MNQPPYGQPPGGPHPGAQQPMQYGYGQPAQQQHHYPQQPVAQAGPTGPRQKGFFGSLFDLSFKNLVAPRVLKVLYVLFLIALVLAILGMLAGAVMAMINEEFLQGLLVLVALPFAAILYLILGRMWFELVIIQFRISEDLHQINEKTKG